MERPARAGAGCCICVTVAGALTACSCGGLGPGVEDVPLMPGSGPESALTEPADGCGDCHGGKAAPAERAQGGIDHEDSIEPGGALRERPGR